VFDETGQGAMKLKWNEHMMIDNTTELIKNLTSQTGLTFEREPREIEMWFLVDDKGEVVAPQSIPNLK